MTEWEERLRSAREDYADRLEQLGFTRVDDLSLEGRVSTAEGSRDISVALHRSFPFFPPLVQCRDIQSLRTWHVDPDDFLCLYTSDDHNDQPWNDPANLLARVTEWFDQAATGWANDVPVLDADRYLPRNERASLLLYGDLSCFLGRHARLMYEGRPDRVVRLEPTPPLTRRGRRKGRRHYARVEDIGELVFAPRSWDDIRDVLPNPMIVEQEIREGTIDALVMQYRRGIHTGVLAVHVATNKHGDISASSYRTASERRDVTSFRRGSQQQALIDRRVLIVGVGAIGSFLADLLARDGLGHLTLRDGDILKPGNVVRHLCGAEDVGASKVHAVSRVIGDRHECTVTADDRPLLDPTELPALFDNHDLVVDASADGAVTAMLKAAATHLDKHVLSVCLQNDGQSCRVDVIPPLHGEPLPPTIQRETLEPVVFEQGCGDPVSPTPPHAVLEAAALGARHAAGMLTGQPLHPAGELREYDAPVPP